MKKVILVVDDDKMNLMIAKRLLGTIYEIVTVSSGEEALTYLGENIPDLVLLDIQMPQMDGFEVMQKMRENELWSRISVIFLTADRTPETEEKCFKMGAVDYIGKPFIPAIMLQRIKRTLELEDYRKNLENMVHEQLGRVTQLQSDIIITMANLIESRDGTTGEHVKRTSTYVQYLVKKMYEKQIYIDDLTPQFVDYLLKATPMHDIGKITISDLILQKPGVLTAEEYEMMKHHSDAGGRLIRENMSRIIDQEFVDIASDIAAHHHEKWNGTGYPDKLKETQIPLCARIVAIADVFDALIAKRQYKEGMPFEKAVAIMRSEREKGFDPILLDVFLESEEELRALVSQLQ